MEKVGYGAETATELNSEQRGQGLHGEGEAGGRGQVLFGAPGDYEGLVQAIISRVSQDSARRLGKIVDQLIKQEQEKLAEAEECVRWYEREVEKHTTSLKELEDLKSQLGNE
ncbi:hypothetical protein [Phormidium sp. FACHB-1136]|uniref:hypothetical protein n=1 Tax=Phormidium sp. FACHB-1136 TaxID=2692848 RepID=UPI001688AE53|nr:hypothetical protein [Phormidium sp. FACHB-1136]MBD2425249.1 hypothetical protein [Phormidium sp. FACHB-1136]